MTKPTANLPVVIFNFALSAYDDWLPPGLGGRVAHRRDRADGHRSWRASLPGKTRRS